MKRIAMLFAFVMILGIDAMYAQTRPITITVNVVGTTGTVSVNFVASPLAPVSSLQFDVSLPASGLVFSSIANGAQTPVGKTASAQVIPGTPDKLRVLVFGLNQTPFVTGEVAKITFSGLTGTYPLPVTGIIPASPAGVQVPATGTDGQITIP